MKFLYSLTVFCISVSALVAQNATLEWVPPEAMAKDLGSTDTGIQILPEITITSLPKATADISKFTNIYEIELSRFGIHNDGTHAEETSKGLNAALQHAKTVGANRIVFPKGTYLINENDPIVLDHKNTVVDLNGAVLQMRPNGLPNYSVVQIIPGAENFRLTNGTIRGERDQHDYKAAKGTHEGGAALRMVGGIQLEVDHLLLENATGDGMASSSTGTRNRDELLGVIKHSMVHKEFESGGFSDKGEKIDSATSVRSIEPYDLSEWGGEYELAYLGGYQGFPYIKGRVYDVIFLDANKKFLEKRSVLQYRKVSIPQGAKFAHFQFHQPEIPKEPAYGGNNGWFLRITNVQPSRDVHFHHNVLKGNRRLGMAYCGGQRWILEDNHFEANGGTAPAFGIDIEDGWELVYDAVFRRNTFKRNEKGDMVICAGTELLVEDNIFENHFVVHGRAHNYAVRNNQFHNGLVEISTRTGVATYEKNTFTDSKRIIVTFDGKGVADGIFRAEGKETPIPPILFKESTFKNVPQIGGTYINAEDSVFENCTLIAGNATRMVQLKGCTLEDTKLEIKAKGPQFYLIEKDNKGELLHDGMNLQRIVETE